MRFRSLSFTALFALANLAPAQKPQPVPHDPELEVIPSCEATQIDHIVALTVEQMKKRYTIPIARGVHPKDHGCVTATFKVSDDLPEAYRVGVFAKPGQEYKAFIRYSNANVVFAADSPPGEHGSRGMAIKLIGIEGEQSVPKNEPKTQDFLMVNHPVFAFANVEDYEAVSVALLNSPKADDASAFFATRAPLMNPAGERARASLAIVKKIKSLSMTATPAAYQTPPASPEEATYFSGAPYLFGKGKVMKYSVKATVPAADAVPNVADVNYLRAALTKRLTASDAKDIVLEFQVQIRTKTDLAGKLETEIENACTEWKDEWHKVATIAISPQDFNTDSAKLRCEALFFTPWHCLADHQPIGGINRLKLGVYQASSDFRHFPKEPAGY